MAFSLVKKILPAWQNAVLALVAAGLLILAFPDFEFWFFAWFALVPLMWAVERQKDSVAACFTIGWIFGTAFFFGTCWWLTYAPIHYAAFPWPLAYFLMLVVSLAVGIFPAIFAAMLAVLIRRFGSWAFLAAPFVWVFTEFLRYWLSGNNWNAIGYSQAFSWFVEKNRLDAQVGGIYLVGFTLLIVNSLVGIAVSSRKKFLSATQSDEGSRNTASYIIAVVTLVTYIFPIIAIVQLLSYLHDYGEELERLKISRARLTMSLALSAGLSMFVWFNGTMPSWSFGKFSTGEAFVTAVQPNVPMSGLDSRNLVELRDRQLEISRSAFRENLERYVQQDLGIIDAVTDENDRQYIIEKYTRSPKIVVLPESPMNFMYNDDREFQQFIGDFARRNNVSVLFNSAEPDATNGKYFNSAVMVGPDGREAAQYDKIFLLPFGEAVPSPLDRVVPGFVGNFSYGREYDILPVGDAKAGVMICFESHFGQLSREYVRNGADVLIEMTNDGYLGPTPVLRQHLANAVFRAVETNRPVLRVTNVGVTAYITENGQVLDAAPTYQEATRVWSVSKSDGSQTFYVKYGDWFAWLCTVVTIGLLIFGIVTYRKRIFTTDEHG
ncbi:MAG TPA: apolipoprotein N-acyltransferase [Pyrinomonadaceae bacterium]|nr:apolipoprotein N-acyltransferase [Pyrinomonadaceae bacterium]